MTAGLQEVPSTNAAAFMPGADNVFARIAERYDFLCDIFSLYAHRLWKSRMAKLMAEEPASLILDVASGTGDIPLRVIRRLKQQPPSERQKTIMVTDLCDEMLRIAQQKIGTDAAGVSYAHMDAHDLRSVESSSIDLFSISFGIKICDRRRVLAEAFRVLKPGGSFFCLEAARIPAGWLHRAYLTYMSWCLPIIARFATDGDASAYNYLLRGIHEFPSQLEFKREIEEHGFAEVTYENLTLGIVALHRARKPK